MKKNISIAICFLVFLVACNTTHKFVYKEVPNTPAIGFDAQNSDTQAIVIADSIVKASGGRFAWDMTHYIKWTFMGKHELVWDKLGEKIRIDFFERNLHIRLNMKDMSGSVMLNGVNLTQTDSLKKYLQLGKSVWLNDGNWLLLSFKLKESGNILKSLGKKNNFVGAECDAIELTTKNPDDETRSKYNIYVNPVTHLITQWDYFPNINDEKSFLIVPNSEYRAYGHIMLSTNRGNGRSLAPVAVYSVMPDSVFTSFYPINWKAVKY